MQKSTRFILTWFLIFLSVEFAYAEVCKGSKVPRATLAQYRPTVPTFFAGG